MKLSLKCIMENIIQEGVYDPSIFKCIFLVGGPGSGKSFVLQQLFGFKKNLTFSSSGLKLVTPDPTFEDLLKKANIDAKELASISTNDPDRYNNEIEPIRYKAKQITNKVERNYLDGRLGVVIEGTGRSTQSVIRNKELMESLGYDCYLVFVNTTLEVAKQRNLKRDRTLPTDVLESLWNSAQQNLGKFQNIFGSSNISIVDNTKDGDISSNISKTVDTFLNNPIKNRIAKEWIKNELKNKKR